MAEKTKIDMEQVIDFGFKAFGAGADDLFDGCDMAIEAWGKDRADSDNSGLLAMAYLWRRFGPPWRGGDNYKSLVDYTLTTADPYVFVWFHLGGCGLALSLGYFVHESLRHEAQQPENDWHRRFQEWWIATHPELDPRTKTTRARCVKDKCDEKVCTQAEAVIGEYPARPLSRQWRTDTGIVHRINRAVYDALKELERPVYIRDCAINIFGRCDDSDSPAERSMYAGYGVPKAAMDNHFSKGETDE